MKVFKDLLKWVRSHGTVIFFAVVLLFCLTHPFDTYILFKLGRYTASGGHDTQVTVENRIAVYEEVFGTNETTRYLLEDYLGKAYQIDALEVSRATVNGITRYETLPCDWFIPSGRHNLRVLIQRDDKGDLSIYKFRRFYEGRDLSSVEKEDYAQLLQILPEADPDQHCGWLETLWLIDIPRFF